MTPNSPAITELSTFAVDVEQGLSSSPKHIPSKYFYDAAGDKLFQQIMAMPEYYLTNCEFEIFEQQKEQILVAFGDNPFELIELGAGDGTKTKILLDYFLAQKADFVYRPIDISAHVLEHLVSDCARRWPDLDVQEVAGDYLEALTEIQQEATGRRKVVFFLGGNIGNFSQTQAVGFYRELASHLAPGDLVLTGFDLKKNPATILAAYNDPAGITAAFNLNLLHRINRELGANFDPAQFLHWETYNPASGEARSYIVSKTDQLVKIKQLQLSVHFSAWEPISVEVSTKYNDRDIKMLATQSGFEIQTTFTDQKHYFVDSLWYFKINS
ncbi:MAG: L-histidine N(alpha)-methyltransferase [Bacteroidetes bacterium]|nr:MAG: L-histidine N(alpha)-methyltransferase [Bacteroidota bacterium]